MGFVRGEISDLKVVDTVFARPEAKNLRQTHEGQWFEATIIAAAQERDLISPALTQSDPITPLQKQYQNHAESPSQDDPDRQQHAAEVIRIVELFKKASYTTRGRGIGFEESVKRLELFSEDLKDEASQ